MDLKGWTTLGWLAIACGCPAGDDGGAGSEQAGSESGESTVSTSGSPTLTTAATESGEAEGAAGSTTGQATQDSTGEPDGSSTGTAAACQLDTPFPDAMTEHVLSHDDLDRELLVYVPSSYDHETPMPMVFAFHGYSNSTMQQEEWSMLSTKAEEAGFILVYPRGVGSPSAWNAGDCCGDGVADDVGFVSAMIDFLEAELCVDLQRVYATGYSNGGFLSHRLACELSDRIAAVASVAGVMGIDDCSPGRPMPVLHMHGTSDFVVPYDGSMFSGFESVAETFAGWAERNGCTGEAELSYENGDVTCELHGECDAGVEVELCTIEGGGHTWPGGADIPFAGVTTQDLSANDRLWEFFVAHPLP